MTGGNVLDPSDLVSKGVIKHYNKLYNYVGLSCAAMCFIIILVNKKYTRKQRTCTLNAKRQYCCHLAVCGVGSLARWLPVAFVVPVDVIFMQGTVVEYRFFVSLVIRKGDRSV